jgi:hypothetical protein
VTLEWGFSIAELEITFCGFKFSSFLKPQFAACPEEGETSKGFLLGRSSKNRGFKGLLGWFGTAKALGGSRLSGLNR